MRISDWSSDVCSSDLTNRIVEQRFTHAADYHPVAGSFERHLGRAAIRIWPPSLDRRTDGDRALIHQYPSTSLIAFVYLDRKSTRLTPVTNAHLVCRLLIEKKKTKK